MFLDIGVSGFPGIHCSLNSAVIFPMTNGNRMSWLCQSLTHLLTCPDTLKEILPHD